MEALAIPNVNEEIESLLSEIMPLYKLLHAYVRFKLGEYYGPEYIGEKEPLPAHLLGRCIDIHFLCRCATCNQNL